MKSPKGKLLIIGGGEHKGFRDEENEKKEINPDFIPHEILKRIEDECPKNDTIVVITTATRLPKEVGEDYLRAFKNLGCTNVDILDIETREDAFNDDVIERIRRSGAVLFSGGNQMRLSTILGGTPVLDKIRDKYENENFIIAGTSAGAMIMSNSMIFEGLGEKAFFKGEIKIVPGFGLIQDVIIDTHFIKRGRFGRLAQAVAMNPSYIGLGLEEDTAVLVRKDKEMEAIGSGNVIIIDGHNIRKTNLTEIDEGAPISIENLEVHILARGDLFSLVDRKFLRNK